MDSDGDGICDALDYEVDSPHQDDNNTECNIVMQDDFESGPGLWIDGGADADRIQNPNVSKSGVFVYRLRDNSGENSAISCTTPILSGNLSVSFSCLAQSMELGESLLLELNRGTEYELVKEWVSGEHFNNLERFEDEVTISNLSNQSVKLRFRCDASTNSDLIYLDDIIVQNCVEETQCIVNSPCDDNDPCTVGDQYNTSCECVPGSYIDADNDGYCAALDSDDSDPCLPDDTGCAPPCASLWVARFENGLSHWNLGGTDARPVTATHIPTFGTRAILLRDNSREQSSIYTDPMNLSSTSDLDIEFDFHTIGFSTGHRFMLELTNSTGSYYSLRVWTMRTDFINGVTHKVTMTAPRFLLDDETVLRLRCDANTNANQVYIDNVRVSQCGDHLGEDVFLSKRSELLPGEEYHYSIFPNPASAILNVVTNDKTATLQLYDMNARKLQALTPNQDNDISQLQEGVYLIRIEGEGGQRVERFLKI